MPQVSQPQHFKDAQRFKQLMAKYQQAKDLISVGAYAEGSDPMTDFAVSRMDLMRSFLQQGLNERAPIDISIMQLKSVITPDPETERQDA